MKKSYIKFLILFFVLSVVAFLFPEFFYNVSIVVFILLFLYAFGYFIHRGLDDDMWK